MDDGERRDMAKDVITSQPNEAANPISSRGGVHPADP